MTPPDGMSLVSEARAQELCGLSRPGWKSWARIGLIEEDPGGVYDERQVLEIALAASLRDHLSPADARAAQQALKRDGHWSEMLTRAQRLQPGDSFDLVIEPRFCAVELAIDDDDLVRAVRHAGEPRLVLVVVLAERLLRIRDGFRRVARPRERPRERKRGRPPQELADVVPFQREPS
jgi:hypothetical protein